MNRTLVAVTIGALCNRLKLIVSAHRIAHETGRTLLVDWKPTIPWDPDGTVQQLPWPGRWQDLFATPFAEGSGPRPKDGQDHVVQRDDPNPVIVRSTWRWLRFEDEPDVDLLSPRQITDAHRAVIRSTVPYLTAATPVASIQARIDAFVAAQGIDRDWTGVHVRMEHRNCRRIGLDAYGAAIDAVIGATPDARFLLCSDSAEAERALLARYGGRMIAYPKESHAVLDGLRSGDALVDLFLLARPGRLIGAGGSTYNEFAWWLSGCAVPLTLIHPPKPA